MKPFIYPLHLLLILGVLACNCVTAPEDGTTPRKEAELLTTQGFDQYMLGRYNESVELFNRALALDPTYVQAWTDKAYAELALKDYINEIRSIDRALEINPGIPRLWNMRGEALMALERYQEAIQSFDKALQFAPDYLSAKLNKENATAKLNKINPISPE
jgi:tetratricopeptide (TPR) repeat protein